MPALPDDVHPCLPPDAPLRQPLHEELHARPSARIRVPALVSYVAVLNAGVSREQELAHLRRLPGQQQLQTAQLDGNFLRLRVMGQTLRWERHNEFSRYTLVQTLRSEAGLGARSPDLLADLVLPRDWLQQIPGQTMVALQLALAEQDLGEPQALRKPAEQWFGHASLVASLIGGGHSLAFSDFQLLPSGFARLLVLTAPGGNELRSGRLVQRLLELETYRMMALQGLPVAKALGPLLSEAEHELAEVTAALDAETGDLDALLKRLTALAARVEHATEAHGYRFAASAAYDAIVQQRLQELREQALVGVQPLGGFLQRRFSPALATVAASARRLEALAQRIERSSALLRTRVDIDAQAQSRELLRQLTRGQALQLSLQTTVEGLSIAAISYYVVSLLGYAGKAAKSAGLPVNIELLTGALIPLVVLSVWWGTRRVHARLAQAGWLRP